MTLKSAIIDMQETGVCKIDIEKVLRLFDAQCSIYRWHDEYKLYQHKYKRIIKIAISEQDAVRLIRELKLEKLPSEIFKHAATFRISARE